MNRIVHARRGPRNVTGGREAVTADEQGHGRFNCLPPGRYILTVYEPRDRVVPVKTILLAPGTTVAETLRTEVADGGLKALYR